MDRPTAFLFDIGNVLLRFDFGIARRRLAERTSPAADFASVDALKARLERGGIDDATFVRRAVDVLGFPGTPEEFASIWQEIFEPNEPMVALVESLAADYPLHLLSNTSGLHLDYIVRRFPFFRHFRSGVYSHEARREKPDEAIYRHAIATLGLDPARTVYVDDLPENAAAGRALGFRTHHYAPDDHPAFLAFLAEQGVTPRHPPD